MSMDVHARSAGGVLTIAGLTFRCAGGATDAGGGLRIMDGDDVVITNCVFDSCQTSNDGGGLYVNKADVVDCIFTNCHATGSGGGLSSAAVSKIPRGCTFIANKSDANDFQCGGGGLRFTAAATGLNRCTFIANRANYGGAYYGAVAVVTDCAFTNNTSSVGGVTRIYTSNASKKDSRFFRCSFVGNRTTSKGGCFYTRAGERVFATDCTFVSNQCGAAGCVFSYDQGAGDSGRMVAISNCVFIGNYSAANDGKLIERGGDFVYGCTFRNNEFKGTSGSCLTLGNDARVENCSFVGGRFGTANNFGSTVFNGGTGVVVRSCLFVSNYVSQGVGVAFQDTGAASQATIENCTFAFNVQNQASYTANYGGTTRLSSHSILRNCLFYRNNDKTKKRNVVWGMDGFSQENNVFNCWEADEVNPQLTDGINGTHVDAVTDLKLADAANGDFRLLKGSPLCDIGNNQPWMAGALDLTLEKRHYRIQNGTVDIGAYEFKPIFGLLLMLR